MFQAKSPDACRLERVLSPRSTKKAMIRLYSQTNNEGNLISEVGMNALSTAKEEIRIKAYVPINMFLFLPSHYMDLYGKR